MQPENLPEDRVIRINDELLLMYKETGLRFGTDAYLLSAMIRGNGRGHAIDLGSGTGVISLLCAAKSALPPYMQLNCKRSTSP